MNNAVADVEELNEFGDEESYLILLSIYSSQHYVLLIFWLKQYSHNSGAPSLVCVAYSKATMMLYYAKLVPGAKVKVPCANSSWCSCDLLSAYLQVINT